VPAGPRSSNIAKAMAVAGVGSLFLGWWFYNKSAIFVLALVFGGFARALVGLVMWCRLASKLLRHTLSITLIVFGTLTLYMALAWGHSAVR
jgi:hypothetical protein